MALPEFTRKLIETKLDRYCDQRVPEFAKDQVQMTYKIKGNDVTLYEKRRAYFDPDQWSKMPIGQFRYNPKSPKWSLYWADRNSKWHLYREIPPTADFDVLLMELDKDPTGVFYG